MIQVTLFMILLYRTLFIPVNGQAYLYILLAWSTFALLLSLDAFIEVDTRERMARVERRSAEMWLQVQQAGMLSVEEMLRTFSQSAVRMGEAALLFNTAMRALRAQINHRQRLRHRVMHATSRRIPFINTQPEHTADER